MFFTAVAVLLCSQHFSAGKEQLIFTHVLGMQQQYNLGQYLRKRYIMDQHFMSPNYTRSEIYVRSTNVNRALESAAANLAGFFPPSGPQKFDKNLNWQPIPVHCDIPESQDLLLKPADIPCPAWKQQYESYYQQYFAQFNKQNELAANLTEPPWVWSKWNSTYPTVWSLTKEIKRRVRNSEFDQTSLAKFKGGYLLGDIVKRIRSMATRSPQRQEPTKMMMYSSHDGTVMSLMYAMGIGNKLLIPFAACVIVELYKSGDQYTVKVLYRNDSSRDPFPMSIPGCPYTCPLNTFLHQMEGRYYNSKSEWAEACGLISNNSSVTIPLALTVILSIFCLVLLVVLSIYALICCAKRK